MTLNHPRDTKIILLGIVSSISAVILYDFIKNKLIKDLTNQ
jgi:hypothetical protein